MLPSKLPTIRFKGKQKPSFESFLSICELLNTTPNYLVIGMLTPGDIPKQISENLRLCDSKDVELLRQISELLVRRNK